MGRENVFAQKRAEAAQAGQNAYNVAQEFYTQPGLSLLSAAPLSYQQGQQFVNTGLGAIGAGTPQLFDPSVGLNLGAAQRANQLAAAQANAQAQASSGAGIMGAIGGIGGGLAQGIGAAGGAAAFFSDKRLKTDIKKVGKTEAGLPIYTYKYKGDNRTQMGVMAQDVEKKTPKAVSEVGGFKAVDYKLVK